MNFGFSYVGLLFLAMLIIPNLIWTGNKPENYDKYAAKESKVLLALERAGEVTVTCIALIFDDFNVNCLSARTWILAAAFLIMILYELYWIRYFKSPKTMKDFYSSFMGIPVAGATLPVIAFLLLGVYGKNPLLIAATLILAVGHIGIHLGHRNEIRRLPGEIEEKE